MTFDSLCAGVRGCARAFFALLSPNANEICRVHYIYYSIVLLADEEYFIWSGEWQKKGPAYTHTQSIQFVAELILLVRFDFHSDGPMMVPNECLQRVSFD